MIILINNGHNMFINSFNIIIQIQNMYGRNNK